MPCSTSRANLSVFNSLRVILDTKTSECDWKFHLSTAPRAGEWAVTAGTRGQARRGQGRKTTAHIGESPEAYGVFHEVSRAEGPSQGSKNHRGEWAPNPGTDRTGSEFPAKCAGNPCQSCQSRRRSWVAMKSPWQFFMSFRGPKAHPNKVEKSPSWRTHSCVPRRVSLDALRPGQRAPAKVPTRRARVRVPHLPVSVPAQFFMKFRGPKAHPNRQRVSGQVRRKFMSVLSVPSDGGYTLLSTLRCTFKRRSTSWRGSSKAEAICSAPSPRRCMRSAWERLLRFSPGLGSPGGGATGG